MAQIRQSRKSRRGNAFVEMALTMVPLFALVFGIIDFSFVIFLKSTFQHAVREGVRYAVTYQLKPGMQHDASIKAVVQDNASGFLAGTTGANKIQIYYFVPDTLAPTMVNAPGNIVEIAVEGFQWGWMAPLLRSGTPLTINVRSSDRMEGLPAGMTAPPPR